MKTRSPLAQIAKKSLYESLNSDMLERAARAAFPDYDLHQRTGFPENIPVPGQVAAAQIVEDCIEAGRFLLLVERLAVLDREGFMGRPYRITGLRELSKGIAAEGYLWDEATGYFMEDPRIRRSMNWGRLLEGEEHRFSLLRTDIVRNSKIVKTHGETAARGAYEDLRSILARCVEHRTGRIWSWEGDGALAAFLFGHSTTSAVLSGMALLHELYLYNRMHNHLGEPIRIRATVHTGPLRYLPDYGEIAKQETVREVHEAESRWTAPDTLTISPAVALTLDRVILDRFKPQAGTGSRHLAYEIGLGGP